MNHKTDIEPLIVRYLDGECNFDEQQKLFLWVASSKINKKKFYRTKDVWDATLKKENKTTEALLQFYKQQASQNTAPVKSLRFWKAAAGIAAVLVVGFISLFMLDVLTFKYTDIRSSSTMMALNVPFGSRSELELSDGTKVVLNSGSELKYPGTFVPGKREVSLTGEAFFEVTSDVNNPFFVSTNDFKVQVTGTQFNVCTYADDSYSSVTLAKGKVGVQLNSSNKVIAIRPGQQLYFNNKGQQYKVVKSDVSIETAWKDGEFCFKEIAFPEMIKRLERWYDVKLYYASSELEKMLYSGNFKNQETIWQVLDALKLTTPIDYKKTGFREFEINYKPMTKK